MLNRVGVKRTEKAVIISPLISSLSFRARPSMQIECNEGSKSKRTVSQMKTVARSLTRESKMGSRAPKWKAFKNDFRLVFVSVRQAAVRLTVCMMFDHLASGEKGRI